MTLENLLKLSRTKDSDKISELQIDNTIVNQLMDSDSDMDEMDNTNNWIQVSRRYKGKK